jgi:16S rRNA (guanine966-N2)-methyltransferase
MRVVAGAAKGRRLVAPKGSDVRPTTDRVKEALFASLAPIVPGAHVLDLFAGSGALGLEALSRGAAEVTLVERARPALDAIRRNVEVVGLSGAHVVAGDALALLRSGQLPGPFDLVLADPPYHHPKAELAETLDHLVAHLAPGATVIVERSVRDGSPPWPPALLAGSPRRYGDTALHRAELHADAAPSAAGAPADEPSVHDEPGGRDG